MIIKMKRKYWEDVVEPKLPNGEVEEIDFVNDEVSINLDVGVPHYYELGRLAEKICGIYDVGALINDHKKHISKQGRNNNENHNV